MDRKALYQKYRSKNFDEVVGQEYIVRSIKNAVRNNKVSHAYLFCGPRGTGKTTMARILAKAVNCENQKDAPCGKCANCKAAEEGTHPDIVEINAANETSVEDIRALIDKATLAPMMGKYKTYIIDEVHQLSSSASSALLKTLEEPPENVIFILATTDPQKLLPTIISRCQRYDFSRIPSKQITDHLLDIAQKENIKMDEQAAEMIASLSDGGMRDALSIMDECASYTFDDISEEAIRRIYGLASNQEKIDLLKAISTKDVSTVVEKIHEYSAKGINLSRFTEGLVNILKDQVIYSQTHNEGLCRYINKEESAQLAEVLRADQCLKMAQVFANLLQKFKTTDATESLFEMACLSLAIDIDQVVVEPVKPVEKKDVKPVIETSTPTQEKPIKEEPVKQEVQQEKPKVQPKVEPIERVITLDEEGLLSILVACNKKEAAENKQKYEKLNDVTQFMGNNIAHLLGDTKLGACGPDMVILTTPTKSLANRLNEKEMNQKVYQFLKDSLDIDRMPFFVDGKTFKNSWQVFADRQREGKLPEARKVIRYQLNEETSKDKVEKFFGDKVKIK